MVSASGIEGLNCSGVIGNTDLVFYTSEVLMGYIHSVVVLLYMLTEPNMHLLPSSVNF